ncbi:MAG: hypothetical protein MZV70_13890 [Desulfobacterales bacterium]|nr:hypothetical protein [Desulfobacterales bacterium]
MASGHVRRASAIAFSTRSERRRPFYDAGDSNPRHTARRHGPQRRGAQRRHLCRVVAR